MARDIGRRNKTGLPVAIRMPAVPAAVTIERTDGSASPVAIEVKAEVEWSISFNPRDLEDYRYAIRQLRLAVSLHHGPDTLRRLLAEETPSTKRALQEARNDRLLAEYLRSGLASGSSQPNLLKRTSHCQPIIVTVRLAVPLRRRWQRISAVRRN